MPGHHKQEGGEVSLLSRRLLTYILLEGEK